jgi:O-acetylhomoserine (thiol)-lyase
VAEEKACLDGASAGRPFTRATELLHLDRRRVGDHGAVHAPMHSSVLYGHASTRELTAVFRGETPGFSYARQGNPTTAALEAKVSLLESARATICFATGMAAISAILLSLLRSGDHIVSSRHVFGNTTSLLATLRGFGVETSFVDATNAHEAEAALRSNTRLMFVETIANPGTQVADLMSIGELCAANGVVFVVDNTLATPALFQARKAKASLVVNSLTKGVGGHGDAMGGAVSDTGLFDWSCFPGIDPSYRMGNPIDWGMRQIGKKGRRDLGGALRPEDAHRISLGAETLELRVERASETALRLARWLQARPEVSSVHYPGLESHGQHERARALFDGRYGALMSFELQAWLDHARLLDALRCVVLSTHLFDTRTLAIPVAQTIFSELGAHGRADAGIGDGLIRLSVGIEPADDLIADFDQAFARLHAFA